MTDYNFKRGDHDKRFYCEIEINPQMIKNFMLLSQTIELLPK